MRATSQRKIMAQSSATNTQLSLFDRSVMVARRAEPAALCIITREKSRCMMQSRQVKGLQIATQTERQITYNETFWTVPSQTSSKSYAVTIDPPFCTCVDFRNKDRKSVV